MEIVLVGCYAMNHMSGLAATLTYGAYWWALSYYDTCGNEAMGRHTFQDFMELVRRNDRADATSKHTYATFASASKNYIDGGNE